MGLQRHFADLDPKGRPLGEALFWAWKGFRLAASVCVFGAGNKVVRKGYIAIRRTN
jgi:hypothetical protein